MATYETKGITNLVYDSSVCLLTLFVLPTQHSLLRYVHCCIVCLHFLSSPLHPVAFLHCVSSLSDGYYYTPSFHFDSISLMSPPISPALACHSHVHMFALIKNSANAFPHFCVEECLETHR